MLAATVLCALRYFGHGETEPFLALETLRRKATKQVVERGEILAFVVRDGVVEQAISAGHPLANPALAGKTALAGKPTAYACRGPRCSPPVTEPDAPLELLRRQRSV